MFLTSDVSAAFPLYYHYHHGTYLPDSKPPFILCLPNLAHCNPISMLIYFNVLDCDHVAYLYLKLSANEYFHEYCYENFPDCGCYQTFLSYGRYRNTEYFLLRNSSYCRLPHSRSPHNALHSPSNLCLLINRQHFLHICCTDPLVQHNIVLRIFSLSMTF